MSDSSPKLPTSMNGVGLLTLAASVEPSTPCADSQQLHQLQQQQAIEDADYDKCRIDYVDEIAHLEAEFARLKSHLFDDRLAFVRAKEQQVLEGRAAEYLEPLAQLTENCRIRLQVAKLTRQLRTRSARHSLDCELQWAQTQLEWDRQLLEERLRSQICQQIRSHQSHLQQQALLHQNSHPTSSQNSHGHPQQQQQQQLQQHRQYFNQIEQQPQLLLQSSDIPKPVSVSGPVIVYQLTEAEILEDCALLRSCGIACSV